MKSAGFEFSRSLHHRSLWLEQALADERDPMPTPPLSGSVRADVCVVGGGYAGLWAALRLKEADPSLDVALLEADICGGGASGRNAGFALSWWVKAKELVKLCGRDDGGWLAREAQDAVDEIGTFCDTHGIDAQFAKQGWLWGATSQAQMGAWDPAVSLAQELGSDVYQPVSGEEFRERSGCPAYVGGVDDTSGATLQPARLARGLRTVLLEKGVRIYEHSPVRSLKGGANPVAVTPDGQVTADRIVLTLGSWSVCLDELRDLRRAMVIISSDAIATEPIPHLLAEHGPRGLDGVSDSRLMVRYARAAEGRLIFGIPGGHIAFGKHVGHSFDYGARRSAAMERTFRELYPSLASARITHAWGGPVDRTEAGVPLFGHVPGLPGVVFGAGFSGNGVAPAVMTSHILTSLVMDRDDRWANNGLVRAAKPAFPPEPFRSVGGLMVRRAVRSYENTTDAGKRASLPVRTLAGLAPAGLVKGSGESGG